MPVIPEYQQRTGALGAGLGPGPTGTGGAGLELGAAAAQLALKVRQSSESWRLADSTAKALGELESFRGELAADEDFDTQSTRYLEKAQEIQKRTMESLSNSTIAPIFKQDFERAAQSGAAQVAVEAQKAKAGKVRTDLGNTLFDLSQLTGRDAETDSLLRAQARIAIESNALTGNLTYSERNALLTKFDQDSSEAAIRRDMMIDPDAAAMKLATGQYPHLSGEVQAVWAQRIDSASYTQQQRKLAQEAHEYTLSERAKKEVADAASKEGDQLLRTAHLTPAWIEANRDRLDPQDYRYFSRALNGGDDTLHDPMLYADLRDRAGRGYDVRAEARVALQRGAIRPSDYDRVVGEVESERPGWYKRGSEYISTMSGYSQLNPTPTAAADKATMLDRWNDWAEAHPKATDREAQIAYQDIVSHNSLVKMNGLPLPKFMVGTRLTPDLQATAKATVEARQKGEIDEAEYARQAQLIKEWRDATAGTTSNPQ